MDAGVSGLTKGVFDLAVGFYRDVNFAYTIAAVMALAAIGLALIALIRHVMQVSALSARTRQLSGYITFSPAPGSTDADDREAVFHTRFREIDAAMGRGGAGGGLLREAWMRYRKTLILGAFPPVRSTQRPHGFVYDVLSPPTWIGFAANIFVAFGLLATFMGLVAALTFAADGSASDNVASMQAALRDLLAAAASKFVTSVAGVGLSLILRLLERLLTVDLRREADRLAKSLESGIRVDPGAQSAALAEEVSGLTTLLRQNLENAPPSPETGAQA